jgi:hypothetical protein
MKKIPTSKQTRKNNKPTKKQPTKIIYTLRKKASAVKDGFYR